MKTSTDSKAGTLAVSLANSLALIPGNTSPLVIGGLIAGLGLGFADSGLVLSCELLFMGITATLMATQMTRINARNATLLGAMMLLLGHGLAATSDNIKDLLVWRSIAGIGGGAVLASVNASIAASPNPARLYGIAHMAPPLIGSLVAFLMSRAIATSAHTGAYGILAVLTLLIIPVMIVFPDYRTKNLPTKAKALQNYGPGLALLLGIFITDGRHDGAFCLC
jgi:hypothetical protein